MSLSLRILLNGATPVAQIDVRFLLAQGHTHTDTYSIVRGDKDVTLHPIMALLVGAIMLEYEFIPLDLTQECTSSARFV